MQLLEKKTLKLERTTYLAKYLDGILPPEVSKHKIPASCKTTVHEF